MSWLCGGDQMVSMMLLSHWQLCAHDRAGSCSACGVPQRNPRMPCWDAHTCVLSQKAGMLRVSRKASLLGARAALPAALGDLSEGTLAPGYVASVTGDAVFVRFLGSLTGRAGAGAKSKGWGLRLTVLQLGSLG